MDRLDNLFNQKKSDILSIYCTAGYPMLEDTIPVITALSNAGVDLVEIGIPFSDPMADGLTIQESNHIALQNGMSVKVLFAQLEKIRESVKTPLLLMGYLNPIIQYGFERFCKDAIKCGIDGFIIPDIPLHEYENTYKHILVTYGLKLIFLITPQTTPDRVTQIDDLSEGFIYLVTSTAVTGTNIAFNTQHFEYLKRIKDMELKHPVLAGFGISTAADFKAVNQFVRGGIIGSRFINMLKNTGKPLEQAVNAFVKSIRQDDSI